MLLSGFILLNVRTTVSKYGPNEIRFVRKAKILIFPYGINNCLKELYSKTKLKLGRFLKTFFKNRWNNRVKLISMQI